MKGSEKVVLKLNIQKTNIMASGPITSWQTDGGKMETVTGFIFLGSKVTADSDCSHEIKRCLLLGRKAMTNLDSAFKSRDNTLPTKVHIVKAMVFLVVTYGCESWTIKKAEWQRTDAFELWCWRRLLRVPWTARRSNQSTLKDINAEYSLQRLMLKLKCQYFDYLMWRPTLLEKTLMLGKVESKRIRGDRIRWLESIIDSMDMDLSKLREMVKDREAWHATVHGVTESWTHLHDWTTTATFCPTFHWAPHFFLKFYIMSYIVEVLDVASVTSVYRSVAVPALPTFCPESPSLRHWSTFSSTPGLCALDARSASSPAVISKLSPNIVSVLGWWAKSTLVEDHWSIGHLPTGLWLSNPID